MYGVWRLHFIATLPRVDFIYASTKQHIHQFAVDIPKFLKNTQETEFNA